MTDRRLAERRQAYEWNHDRLTTARGCMWGMVISGTMWTLGLVVVWWLVRR